MVCMQAVTHVAALQSLKSSADKQWNYAYAICGRAEMTDADAWLTHHTVVLAHGAPA